jgi:hypothetical protein
MHIINQKGLHARASAKFVQTVEKFNAEVGSAAAQTVGGTSIMGLMMLAASPGRPSRSKRAAAMRPPSLRRLKTFGAALR